MGDDRIDGKLAKRFAWGQGSKDLDASLAQGEAESTDDAPESDAESTPEEKAAWRATVAANRHAADAIAGAAERLWVEPDAALQRQRLQELLRRVGDLALGAIAVEPVAVIRLLRLLVRHWGELPAESRAAALAALLFCRVDHADFGSFIVEVARAGLGDFDFHITTALRRAENPFDASFGDALADVIVSAPSWRSRALAARYAEHGDGPRLRGALRSALRAPHLVLREAALSALEAQGVTLDEDDLVWLVEDAVVHPTDEFAHREAREAAIYYARDLATAVTRARPKGAAGALERIARGDCPFPDGIRSYLDADWALPLLVAVEPARGEVVVAEFLRSADDEERLAAVLACGALPHERARDPLLVAARDGHRGVAEAARDAWREIFSTPCPVTPEQAVPEGMLDRPPSERLSGRLLAARGPDEARIKLALTALREAPDVEALALIVVLLAEGPECTLTRFDEATGGPSNWFVEIARRFGDAGVHALTWLARRYDARRPRGWLAALEAVPTLAELTPAAREELAELATDAVLAPPGEDTVDAVDLLAATGLPRDGRADAVVARLLAIALDGRLTSFESSRAVNALIAHVDGARLGEAAEGALAAADASGDSLRIAQAACVAASFPHRGTLDAITRRAQAICERETLPPAEVEAWSDAIRTLRERKAVNSAWLAERLARPETVGFELAASAVRGRVPRRCARLLRGALERSAESPRAAVIAAHAGLAHWKWLSRRSILLTRAFVRSPILMRANLLVMYTVFKVPIRAAMWPAIEELLTSADPEVQACVDEQGLHFLPWKRGRARLVALYPRVTSKVARAQFERMLHLPTTAPYWQDSADP